MCRSSSKEDRSQHDNTNKRAIQRERYWFDNQYTEDSKLVTEAVKTFRNRNDDNSRRK